MRCCWRVLSCRVSSSNAAEWTRNDEVNGLKHDTPFLLTTKKGGGTYEFSITLAADRKLDSDHIVFGRMLEVSGWPRPVEVGGEGITNVSVGGRGCVDVCSGRGRGGRDPEGAREQGGPHRIQAGEQPPHSSSRKGGEDWGC